MHVRAFRNIPSELRERFHEEPALSAVTWDNFRNTCIVAPGVKLS